MEVNAYAPTSDDDRDDVDTAQGSSPSGCFAVGFGLLFMGLLGLLVAFIATITYREASPPPPALRFGDYVEVVSGFHEGCRGEVISADFWASPSDPMGQWEYLVRMDAGHEFIAESALRKLSDGEVITLRDAYGRVRYGRILQGEDSLGRVEQLEDDVSDLRRRAFDDRPRGSSCWFPPAESEVADDR